MSLIHKFTLSWAKLFSAPRLVKSSLSLWQDEHCGQGCFLKDDWYCSPAEERQGKGKERERERDVKIDAWVSGLFNKAKVWYKLQTSNTATSSATQSHPEPRGHPLWGWDGERKRAKEGESFRILQGPTKATLLLHLLYIIWQTGSNREQGGTEKESEHTERKKERGNDGETENIK